MPALSVVVVTYNSAAEIAACLRAAMQIPDAEIIVVDNASADETVMLARAARARVIANDSNTGFAAAVNTGVRAAAAPLILLLNPDAHYRGGMEHLVGCFGEPAVAAAGGLLTDPAGEPQRGFMARGLPSAATLAFEVLGINRVFPWNSVNRRYRCLGLDPGVPTSVEQPAGAFLMFRKSCWELLGGFDEAFWPIWFEDVDFCARIRERGWQIRYAPGAVAQHSGGHSIHSLAHQTRERYWYGSLLKYAGRHCSSMGVLAVRLAVVVGAAARAVFGLPRFGFRSLSVYGGVIRLALAGSGGSGRSGKQAGLGK